MSILNSNSILIISNCLAKDFLTQMPIILKIKYFKHHWLVDQKVNSKKFTFRKMNSFSILAPLGHQKVKYSKKLSSRINLMFNKKLTKLEFLQLILKKIFKISKILNKLIKNNFKFKSKIKYIL